MSAAATASTAGAVAPLPTNPHDLIKRVDVELALRADKGPKAKLESFAIKDFTTKGDNYACVVSSVELQYQKDGRTYETSYVVKLNPCRTAGFGKMTETIFEKEIGFYTDILPLLNKQLAKAKEAKLRTPQYLHSVGRVNEQVIYMDDLRRSGYKMFDRKKGMDKKHTQLILQELGRLHAASVLLMSTDEFRGVDMKERFPAALREAMDAFVQDDSPNAMNDMFDQVLENSGGIADLCEGYEYVSNFLRSKKGNMGDEFERLIELDRKFTVICHGDCWNNNFLFRYDQKGNVVECRLVDLQIARIASPVLDLNYMLYCSLDGATRSTNLPCFFAGYYASFASVMAAAMQPMPFTLAQFTKEFYDKNIFGLMMGMSLIPIVLMDSEDAPSFDDFKGDDIKQSMAEFQDALMASIKKNPLLKPRFFSMFEEMKESGLFKTANVSKLVNSFNSMAK